MVGMASVARTSAVIAALARVALAAVCGENNVPCKERFGELCKSFLEAFEKDSGSNNMDATPKPLSETAWAALLNECPDCVTADPTFEPNVFGEKCPAGSENSANEEQCRQFQQEFSYEWTNFPEITGTGVYREYKDQGVKDILGGVPCGCIINPNLDVQGGNTQVIPGTGVVMFVPDDDCVADYWTPSAQARDVQRFANVCGNLPETQDPFACPAQAVRLHSELPHLFSTMAGASIPAALAAALFLFVIATRRRSVGNKSLAVQMDESSTDCQELTPHA